MGRRLAFLIGNQSFGPGSGLEPLEGPLNDVAALEAILADQGRGAYEVAAFRDQDRATILPSLEEALNAAEHADMVLLFYAGHGKLDPAGRLCLATAETRSGALYSTSIPAAELRNLISNSRCEQVVLLLDCCYSGAVGRELARGGVEDQLALMREAQGLHVLTASTGFQTAREMEDGAGGTVMGKFTRAIVDGIVSGQADCDGDGAVTLSDLRRHLKQAIRGQTPQYWAQDAAGDPLIAHAGPAETPVQKRLRRLGAWYADGLVPERDYVPIATAASGQGDRRLVTLVCRLLDKPLTSPEALLGAWAGATRPPRAEPADMPRYRESEPERAPSPTPPPEAKPAPSPAAQSLALGSLGFSRSDWLAYLGILAVLVTVEESTGGATLEFVAALAAVLAAMFFLVKLVRRASQRINDMIRTRLGMM